MPDPSPPTSSLRTSLSLNPDMHPPSAVGPAIPAQPVPVGPNKAIAAGISGAAVTLLMALITGLAQHYGAVLDPVVIVSLGTVLTAFVGVAAVWLTPHGGPIIYYTGAPPT